ncbi:MAG: UDP-2,3-diacylglucosamine diphosphatase LpxI, partial [Planctomycetota bacterium]|nr:UDP-2,3-diacylglucosamine diphosphatase LpxI [Planctomycetota bacterium]
PRPLFILPDPPPPPTPLGLIAGAGQLPLLVARGMRERGHPVRAIGLIGHYDPALPELCDRFQTVGPLRVGKWGPRLRRMGVHHAVMVGRVDKANLMHDPLRMIRHVPDWRAAVLWYRRLRHDRRSSEVLLAVADELARSDVHLLDSTAHIEEHLADPGVMTDRQPTPAQWADIEFGWPLLSEALRLDIGQSMAVRERDVLAVEAVEGTDRMIERAGRLCRATGWTMLKGARMGHDRRADVPTIGETPHRHLHKAGGRCLAVAAGDVIVVDKPRTLATADELGVALVGVPEIGPAAMQRHAASEAPAGR